MSKEGDAMTTQPQLRVLSLGWGVQSWTLAAMMALNELPRADYLVHADTTWERGATYEFAQSWTPWLSEHGLDVVTVKSNRTEIIEEWQGRTNGVMIPAFTIGPNQTEGQLRRQCTNIWKVQPVRRFLSAELGQRNIKKSPGVAAMLMGISLDEFMRMKDSDVKYVQNEYPLVDLKMTRQDCIAWLERQNLPIPPKSACVFCPYHSKETWQRMGRAGGPDFEVAARVDETVRNMRSKHTAFVHRSCRPLREVVVDDGQLAMWPDDATCDSGYCFT